MTGQIDAKKLLGRITIESVTKQIENDRTNPFFISEFIVGSDVWRSLSDWDRQILAANVHKIAVEDENLRKKYFDYKYP